MFAATAYIMKTAEFIEMLKFYGIPVFTAAEASRIVDKGAKYTSLYLSRIAHSGKIARIEKGKYYITGSSSYAVASNITHPSYASMMSAFKYYGLTTQNISSIDIVSVDRHSSMELMGYSIIFNKVPRGMMFGFRRVGEDGAFMAYPEKALIDAMLFGGIPMPYIIEAFANAREMRMLDTERLSQYAARIGSKELDKKIKALMQLSANSEAFAWQ